MPTLPWFMVPPTPPPIPNWPQTPLDVGRQANMYRQWMPQQLPRSLLDQYPDVTPMMRDPLDPRSTRGMLGADIAAKIYRFPFDNPATEGAGGRGLGARGGGLLGSKWRDPRFVEQEAQRRGIEEGRLQGPSARVIPYQGAPRFMQSPSDAAWEAKFRAGLDPVTGKPIPFSRAEAIQSQRENAPTGPQMARPVRATPEIQAKLAAARAARAKSEGMRLVEDARALMAQRKGMKPFDSKVIADRFNRMDVDQREIFNRIMFPQDYRD